MPSGKETGTVKISSRNVCGEEVVKKNIRLRCDEMKRRRQIKAQMKAGTLTGRKKNQDMIRFQDRPKRW